MWLSLAYSSENCGQGPEAGDSPRAQPEGWENARTYGRINRTRNPRPDVPENKSEKCISHPHPRRASGQLQQRR